MSIMPAIVAHDTSFGQKRLEPRSTIWERIVQRRAKARMQQKLVAALQNMGRHELNDIGIDADAVVELRKRGKLDCLAEILAGVDNT